MTSESGDGKGDGGARTVFCGNLAWKVGWQDLKRFFNEAEGEDFEVEHAEVLEYRDGKKTGSGVVRFKTVEQAEKAIAEWNEKPLKGRDIFLRADTKGGKGPGSVRRFGKGAALPEDAAAAQVYVGNLSYHTSWQSLKDFMGEAGEVVYCDILRSPDGRSAGAGLVRYKTKEEAEKAIAELTDHECDGRPVFIREDREGRRIEGKSSFKGKGKSSDKEGGGKGPKEGKAAKKEGKAKKEPVDRSNEVTVEIKGVAADTTWKLLKDEFTDFHCVHTAMVDGVAVVKFANEEHAQAMIDSVYGKKMLGCDDVQPAIV
eukprot:g8124.t1